MITQHINILLADDDKDDCFLFHQALEELPVSASLRLVYNGEQLMEELTKKGSKLPDILFLDLNMPLKTGFSALGAIKRNIGLQDIPVIIFSTSSDLEAIKNVFRDAAHYYIIKPNEYSKLKKVIYEALTLMTRKDISMPLQENFMITGDSVIIPEKK